MTVDWKPARLHAMTAAERSAELQRQTQLLAKAIQRTIEDTSKSFEIPLLNGLAAALVTIEAGVLASVGPRERKILRRSMDKMRPGALADMLALSVRQARSVVVGGFDA